jgi:hypothetical protein
VNASQISSGSGFSCAHTAQQEIQCWGANYRGQLGDGNGAFDRLTPQYIATARCDLDLDGNGSYSQTTDGLLYARALTGLSGTSVINGAIGAGATRTTWPEIRDYLTQVCKVRGLAS